MSDDPQMIYEDGVPTGHTSWGPDPEERCCGFCGVGAVSPCQSRSQAVECYQWKREHNQPMVESLREQRDRYQQHSLLLADQLEAAEAEVEKRRSRYESARARAERSDAEVESLRGFNKQLTADYNALLQQESKTLTRAERAEAEVEKLRGPLYFKWQEAEGRCDEMTATINRYIGLLDGADKRVEKAEAKRDRLAEALRAIAAYDPGQDWYMQQPIDIARSALEGTE